VKLTKEQIDKIKQTVLDLERKIEEMEQQDYITFDLGKDLQNLSYMVDVLKEELKK
jgi:predicted transport protein